MPSPSAALAARLHTALLGARQTVAAAESLTAGLLCATLAAVPGASATLRGGLVVYATDLKATLAGVPEPLLAEHGPVSSETARALAAGVRARCGADWGVALTGVAGPDPVDGHPPGTVHVAVAGPGVALARLLELPGDRAAVRAGSVDAAVQLLLSALDGAGGRGGDHPGDHPAGRGNDGPAGTVTP